MQQQLNQNVVATSDEHGINIINGATTIGIPKDDAIRYAQQGISNANKDGFVEYQGKVTLVHGTIRHTFEGDANEAGAVISIIEAQYLGK